MATPTNTTISVDAVSSAIDSLPITEQLEFAHTIIFGKGGDPHSEPFDAELVLAGEVVRGVIDLLRENSPAGKISRLNTLRGLTNG